MGGAGLGAVSSYSVKFQMSELISGDFSQRHFVRSSVNLTSSNKIEERDCPFAYWFIFLLSHIFGSVILIKGQAQLHPLRDYGCPSFTHTHTLLLFHPLILIYLPFSSCLNPCLVSGRRSFCFQCWGELFPELSSKPTRACTARQHTDLGTAG